VKVGDRNEANVAITLVPAAGREKRPDVWSMPGSPAAVGEGSLLRLFLAPDSVSRSFLRMFPLKLLSPLSKSLSGRSFLGCFLSRFLILGLALLRRFQGFEVEISALLDCLGFSIRAVRPIAVACACG
jgi:hypothetical protein